MKVAHKLMLQPFEQCCCFEAVPARRTSCCCCTQLGKYRDRRGESGGRVSVDEEVLRLWISLPERGKIDEVRNRRISP
jgi:hypothetical protein